MANASILACSSRFFGVFAKFSCSLFPTRTLFWKGFACSPDLLDQEWLGKIPRVFHGTNLKLGGRRQERKELRSTSEEIISRDNCSGIADGPERGTATSMRTKIMGIAILECENPGSGGETTGEHELEL